MIDIEDAIKNWDEISDLIDLKIWCGKYLSVEQQNKFDERAADLQEVWSTQSGNDKGMTVKSSRGSSTFDPEDPSEPVLEDVDYFSVHFIMDFDASEYTLIIPYKEGVVLNPIACLPEKVAASRRH